MKTNRANPGRVAAALTLVRIETGGHAEKLLADLAPKAGPDRRLAWHLVYGVLRNRAIIDASLKEHLRQPLAGLEPEVCAALRLGAFEKLIAKTKPHAAVDQAVEVVKRLGRQRAKGLVNAIVRRASIPKQLSRADRLNHPDWLIERWDARHATEDVDAWCMRNNRQPELFAVTKTQGKGLVDEWKKLGLSVNAVEYEGSPIPSLYRLGGPVGAIHELHGFAQGEFWIQDTASVIAADLVSCKPGMKVLDACAAPGGKTLRMASQGAIVTACDLSESRLNTLSEGAERVKLTIETKQHDWTTEMLDEGTFDAVLVDAPCTGLGTLRRKPEIRWRRNPLDIEPAAELQFKILRNAAKQVKVGGAVTYSVCTPAPEEGREIIKAFLNENPKYTLEVERETAPPKGDIDAFYMARMVRK